MKWIICVPMCCVSLVLAAGTGSAAEVAELVKTIKAVGPEASGNNQASAAWKQLAGENVRALPAILAAMDDASPLAVNWLRSAVETIAQRELDRQGKLPVAELEKFLLETSHDPRGRRLAFELLERVDETARERLVPGMLNDPSVELRREAVQRLIAQANQLFDTGKKDDAKPIYKTALGAARDDDQVQSLVKRLGELGEKVDLPRHFGFLTTWRLVAPFDNTDKKGFNVRYRPEESVDFNAEYEGKGGKKIRWVEYATQDQYGIVDLNKALEHFKGAVSYAATEFQNDKEQNVELRLGTPNAWKVWLNGKLLFARDEYHRGAALDQYRMRGTLQPGKNLILVKICQNEQTEDWAQRWQIQLRVCDATGTAVLSKDRAQAAAKVQTSSAKSGKKG